MNIQIKNRAVPNTPRSKNYGIGTSVTINNSSSAGSTASAETSVDIIPEGSSKAASDTNVYSALYVLRRFIQNSQIISSEDEAEFSDETLLSSLRVLAEISKNNQALQELFLRKDIPDTALGKITFEDGIIVKGGSSGEFSGSLTDEGGEITEEHETVSLSGAITELVGIEGGTLGSLSNVGLEADHAATGSLLVKNGQMWNPVSPEESILYDFENMLVPVYHKEKGWIFISASLFGSSPPQATGFPYTLPFILS